MINKRQLEFALYPRNNGFIHHGLHFVRHTGQTYVDCTSLFHPHSRRSSIRILNHNAAFRHEGLAAVHLGYLASPAGEKCLNITENAFVSLKFSIEVCCECFFGDVIPGWTQSSRYETKICP